MLGAGLTLANGRAVFEALGPGPGEWERTPKTGAGAEAVRGAHYRVASRSGRGEAALALYFSLAIAATPWTHHDRSVPFLGLLVAGFAYVAVFSRPRKT